MRKPSLLTVFLLTIFLTPSRAQTGADLMNTLDGSIWIADGRTASKQIYVIAAPWCPYCRALYQSTRGMEDKVQIRWIEADGRDDDGVSFVGLTAANPSPDLLAAMYGPRPVRPHAVPSPLRQNVAAYTEGLAQFMWRNLNRITHGEFGGYPTLIWMEADGIHGGGHDVQVASVIDRVVERPQGVAPTPAGKGLVELKFSRQPILSDQYCAALPSVRGRALPDEHAPPSLILRKGLCLTAVNLVVIDGERWIEAKGYGSADHRLFTTVFMKESELFK